jgi:hypothetical protein
MFVEFQNARNRAFFHKTISLSPTLNKSGGVTLGSDSDQETIGKYRGGSGRKSDDQWPGIHEALL